ncbi:hypothetical protein D039_0148A, partial [Vibrio parahaemolyticus EKP-028]
MPCGKPYLAPKLCAK